MSHLINPLQIIGIGLVSPLGSFTGGNLTGTPDKMAALLHLGQDSQTVETTEDAGLPASATASAVPATSLADISQLPEFVEKKDLRRIPRLGRMGILAACLALRDIGLETSLASVKDRVSRDLPPYQAKMADVALVTASALGPLQVNLDYLNSLQDFGQDLISPTAFSTSLQHSLCSTISMQLKMQGPCLSLGQGMHSFHGALQSCASLLETGLADKVLLVLAEEKNPEVDAALRESFGEDCICPYEGALALVLSKCPARDNSLTKNSATGTSEAGYGLIDGFSFSKLPPPSAAATTQRSFVLRSPEANPEQSHLGFSYLSSLTPGLLAVAMIPGIAKHNAQSQETLTAPSWVYADDPAGCRARLRVSELPR